MQMTFTAVDPSELKEGRCYLCGEVGPENDLDWMFCVYSAVIVDKSSTIST